jgi:hypothetical protein
MAAAKLSLVVGTILAAMIGNAVPAFATDNSFVVWTGTTCDNVAAGFTQGFGTFKDYGEGAPGGGNNDDYIIISDSCFDGDSVAAYAWENGTYLGGKVNAKGGGTNVVWDPFGNVEAGHTVGLKVCLWTSSRGPFFCTSTTRTITDG